MTHTPAALLAVALKNEEGVQAHNGALVVNTGARKGRSPKDRYIVKDALTSTSVDWGAVNQPLAPDVFETLWSDALHHLNAHPIYEHTLAVGADEQHRLFVKTQTNLAWHALFCHNLFIDGVTPPPGTEIWTLISPAHFTPCPEGHRLQGNAAIAIDFSGKRILVSGTHYAGEMKKALFSVLNYLLPTQDVLPMHCSANVGDDGKTALFFGLSGTGKTTLSATPDRQLIGDDEHGWSKDGIFNFEGGCYAKCINLSQDKEPMIWGAIREGAVLENVVLDGGNKPDYTDTSLTENTRAAYPLSFIQNSASPTLHPHPSAVVLLTCDLFGVLPPVSKLTYEQAAYYFLSGYTALVGSTEVGSSAAIKSTFSQCFGAPFFPRPATVYADLFMKRLKETNPSVYLVNTGWTGGQYGKGGERFSIPTTRSIVNAVLDSSLNNTSFEYFPRFNIQIPKELPGVDNRLLNPKMTWSDHAAFDEATEMLIHLFQENFKKFQGIKPEIAQGAPK